LSAGAPLNANEGLATTETSVGLSGQGGAEPEHYARAPTRPDDDEYTTFVKGARARRADLFESIAEQDEIISSGQAEEARRFGFNVVAIRAELARRADAEYDEICEILRDPDSPRNREELKRWIQLFESMSE
jgi:hypothetical protein